MISSKYDYYPYRFSKPTKAKQAIDIFDLQREIVQKIIRTNNRLKLSRILYFVKEELEQK